MKEFLLCNRRGTHKVPRYQYKAINTCLAAPAKQQQKVILKMQNVLRINTAHQTRINNIVMRHNHQHREDSEKFNVRTPYPP